MGLLNKKILSIDFGSHEIKVIEGKYAKNGISISKSFKVRLPGDVYEDGEILDKNTIRNLLKKSLRENKVKSGVTYGVINSSSIITREVIIPKVPDKEIDSLISFQLKDFLPIDPDDYVVNSLVLENITQDEVERVKILLIAVPKHMVLSHLELIKDAGLKPCVLDYQGNSIAKLFKYSDFINQDYNTRDIVIASIDIGYSTSKLSIVKNGNIEVSRVIDLGSQTLYSNLEGFFDYPKEELEEKVKNIPDITVEDEDFTDEARLVNLTRTSLVNIMERIEPIFRYYTSRESSNLINLIVLQGGTSNINEIDNLFSNYFNISTIKLSDLEKVNVHEDLKTYSNAIGSLIRADEVER